MIKDIDNLEEKNKNKNLYKLIIEKEDICKLIVSFLTLNEYSGKVILNNKSTDISNLFSIIKPLFNKYDYFYYGFTDRISIKYLNDETFREEINCKIDINKQLNLNFKNNKVIKEYRKWLRGGGFTLR